MEKFSKLKAVSLITKSRGGRTRTVGSEPFADRSGGEETVEVLMRFTVRGGTTKMGGTDEKGN